MFSSGKLPATMASYLITNARILDGTGTAPFAGSVRVEDGRITEVTARPHVPAVGAPT